MPMKADEFTAKQVRDLRAAGQHAVGGVAGLLLQVTSSGSRSWILRATVGGKRRSLGLGGFPDVSLSDARRLAREAKDKIRSGTDPIEERQAHRRRLAEERARRVTFRIVAIDYIAAHRPEWRSEKHARQWETTMERYVFPTLGNKAIQDISTADVLAALKPIWLSRPETARRVRNRIELVIDAGRARGLSTTANPAAWRGHLDKLLSKRPTGERKHHAALDYHALPALFEQLRKETSPAHAALRFVILTACRSGEALDATWPEIDLGEKLWTVPASRTKAGRVHRVPLTDAVVEILESLPRIDGNEHLFPGQRRGRPLNRLTLFSLLRRIGYVCTTHGFRSSFRDWASEETHYPAIVAEQALGHKVGTETETAYRRGDLLAKRRALMADWASHCTQAPAAANVVPIKSNTAASR